MSNLAQTENQHFSYFLLILQIFPIFDLKLSFYFDWNSLLICEMSEFALLWWFSRYKRILYDIKMNDPKDDLLTDDYKD
jgi:hypothetical protein